jgi:hypothetical protein
MAPDLNSKRARLADWVELKALTAQTRSASISVVRSLVRQLDDGRSRATDVDTDAETEVQPEITERLSDDMEERIFEELSFRADKIGNAYPFKIEEQGAKATQHLLRKDSWREPEQGELFYIFCLLNSALRDGLIECPKDTRYLKDALGNLFQICSCVAVAGYTKSEIASFGFPRAAGDSFLPALQKTWKRYGSFDVRNNIPFGFDESLKDGGIDIIAWRHFPDGYAATLILFAQVASGMGWKDKEIAADVRQLRQWFEGAAFTNFSPAICIPFPLWFDMDEPPNDELGKPLPFSEGVRRKFIYREAKFGIIFDRGRIATSCASALAAKDGDLKAIQVDGMDQIDQIESWVVDAMERLEELRA